VAEFAGVRLLQADGQGVEHPRQPERAQAGLELVAPGHRATA
jgi:hypothetical protein